MPKGQILVVDDQRYFRELIEGLLVEEGYEVQTSGSGEEALQILEQHFFDVVITDLVMPVMSGTDLVHKARERWPELKVLLTSGYAEDVITPEGALDDEFELLRKPYRAENLSQKVQEVLTPKSGDEFDA